MIFMTFFDMYKCQSKFLSDESKKYVVNETLKFGCKDVTNGITGHNEHSSTITPGIILVLSAALLYIINIFYT